MEWIRCSGGNAVRRQRFTHHVAPKRTAQYEVDSLLQLSFILNVALRLPSCLYAISTWFSALQGWHSNELFLAYPNVVLSQSTL